MNEVVTLVSDQQALRQAPHNAEAEAALLGAILINNEAFYRVIDFLKPEHFHIRPHRKIYETISELIRAGKIATPITVKTFFKAEEMIGELSVPAYLLRLHGEATTIINVADYAATVYELALRRELIGIGEDMVNVAYDGPVDMPADKQIQTAEQHLFSLAERGRADGGFVAFASALDEAIELATAAFQSDRRLSGTPTYMGNLDTRMGGLQRSDLIILAGRPAMGKTALATNVAFNIAKNWRGGPGANSAMETEQGGIVGYFSLEMSSEQLATRILAEQSGVSSARIRRGDIKPHEFEDVVRASQEMQAIPLYIDQTGGISVAQLAARARRLKRQKGLDLLIVDYLQLMQGTSRRASENRVQEITEITTGLKALAKELDIPILALSQLSRQVEAREDKRPQLSDLRESGSIEQDADVVLFVFREEYYLQNKEPKPNTEDHLIWQDDMNRVHGLAEVIIGKQRHGPTGTAKLTFEAELTRFGDYIEDDHLPERMD